MTSAKDKIHIRQATIDDLPAILQHRRRMFEDMGFTDPAALDAMLSTSEPYMGRGLREGFYKGWVGETTEGRIVAGGGILITLWPSHPSDPELRRASILNLYTEPEYRRQGLARRLMHTMIEWCRREGFAWVSLHASEDGTPLYVALGFKPSNEMRLSLR